MKKRILPLLAISLLNFGCFETPTQNNPTTSNSPSPSVSPTLIPAPISSLSPGTTPTTQPVNNNTSASVSCSNEEPVIGNTYQDIGKFSCVTDAKINSKWTYSTTTMGITSDISIQIIEVNGDKYTIQSEVTVNGEKKLDKYVSTTPSGYKQDTASTTSYKYEGKEGVTVGSGTFDAYKFTGSESKNGVNVSYIAYMAKTRGLVKMVVNTEAPIVGTISTEVTLKAFQP